MVISAEPSAQVLVRAEVSFRPSTIDVENRTVEVVMSTETPFPRATLDGEVYHEVLDHSPQSVRMERALNGAPVLDNHNRAGETGRSQIGVIDSARFEGRSLVGVLRFSRKPEADVVFQDIVDGIIRNFSVGYIVHRSQVSEKPGPDGHFTRTVTDWEFLEVSAVSVPADPRAQVRSAQQNNNTNINNTIMEEVTNAAPAAANETAATVSQAAEGVTRSVNQPTQAAQAPPIANAQPAVDLETVRAAERERINDIRTRCQMAGVSDDAVITRMINDGVSGTAVTDQIRAAWQAQQGTVASNNRTNAVTRDDADALLVDGISGAIALRAGVAGEAPNDNVRRFAGMSMPRIAEEVLRHRGISTAGLSRAQTVQQAFTRSGGFHSSTDFPLMFGNVINRSLLAAYNTVEQSFRPWTSGTTHADFRVVEKVRMSEMIGAVDRVPEGGEYKAGTFNESKEGYAVQKWGKKISYTMEMAINDDIGFFNRVPAAIARKFARHQNDLVYTILNGNPLMEDGENLFSVAHKNLVTGSALDETNLELAITAFRKQTDREGNFINVAPRYLIVGPNNYFAAKRLMTTITPNTTADVSTSSVAGMLEIITDPIIGDAWFLAAQPGAVDTIEYAFLEGQPEVFTEMQESFNVDATTVKARMIFGTKALDHVGLLMNPGA